VTRESDPQRWVTSTHADPSNNMKASTFSCGESPLAAHPPGNPVPGVEDESPDMCTSANSTFPQRLATSASFGVVN
jgi:hypothetical protein